MRYLFKGGGEPLLHMMCMSPPDPPAVSQLKEGSDGVSHRVAA